MCVCLCAISGSVFGTSSPCLFGSMVLVVLLFFLLFIVWCCRCRALLFLLLYVVAAAVVSGLLLPMLPIMFRLFSQLIRFYFSPLLLLLLLLLLLFSGVLFYFGYMQWHIKIQANKHKVLLENRIAVRGDYFFQALKYDAVFVSIYMCFYLSIFWSHIPYR